VTDVPFQRFRTATFRIMLAALAATAAVVVTMDGEVADDLTIIGLCVVTFCALFSRLLFFWAQRQAFWRLRNCESELCRHQDRITGFDNTIMSYFRDEDPTGLYVVGSAAPDRAPEATSGSAPVAEVLAFRPPEWTR
jgi:hypothetical protein